MLRIFVLILMVICTQGSSAKPPKKKATSPAEEGTEEYACREEFAQHFNNDKTLRVTAGDIHISPVGHFGRHESRLPKNEAEAKEIASDEWDAYIKGREKDWGKSSGRDKYIACRLKIIINEMKKQAPLGYPGIDGDHTVAIAYWSKYGKKSQSSSSSSSDEAKKLLDKIGTILQKKPELTGEAKPECQPMCARLNRDQKTPWKDLCWRLNCQTCEECVKLQKAKDKAFDKDSKTKPDKLKPSSEGKPNHIRKDHGKAVSATQYTNGHQPFLVAIPLLMGLGLIYFYRKRKDSLQDYKIILDETV